MPDPKSSIEPDDNDLAIAGTLPEDPEDGTRIIDDGPRVLTVRDLLGGAYYRAITPRSTRSCTTGSTKLNEVTGGMRPGMTWVVMALSSWGKSSWVVSTADDNLRIGKRVLIVSCEDSPEVYGNRLLARRARISATNVVHGKMTPEESEKAREVIERAEPLPVYLDAIGKPAEWTLEQIPKVVKAYGIDMVFVDYIQEIWSGRKHEDRRLQLAWIAGEIRATLKRLKITGAVMSQITPREGATPTKQDVRDSKDITFGAEVVAIGHEPTEKPLETRSCGTIAVGERCFIVDKNKDGPKGVVRLIWDPISACFRDEPDSSYDDLDDRHEAEDHWSQTY